MGCFAKLKPMRTSAKDSKTGCCTITKVLAFYVFGCTACRKARKKAPKETRQQFYGGWKHEIEMGTNIPLTPRQSNEPRPRPARPHGAEGVVNVQRWDEKKEEALSRVSRLPKRMRVTRSPVLRGLSEPEQKGDRKSTMQNSPSTNLISTSLGTSTPEERNWMFLPPEAAGHMRSIKQRGHTWLTKQDEIGKWEKAPRNPDAARVEAERKEKDYNGTEKWNIREIGLVTQNAFREGTKKLEAFCKEKLEPSSIDQAAARATQEQLKVPELPARGDSIKLMAVTSRLRMNSRSASPRPPPPATWAPMTAATNESSGSVTTADTSPHSISPSTARSTPLRRDSEDTAKTGSTDLTIPDDPPWLKEASETPLPMTPVTELPTQCSGIPKMTLGDYFPILKIPLSELPAKESEISDAPISNSSLPDLPNDNHPAVATSFMNILRNSKYVYKPHLAWEEWRAQKRNAAGCQHMVLGQFGEEGPAYIATSTRTPKNVTSMFREGPSRQEEYTNPIVQKPDGTIGPIQDLKPRNDTTAKTTTTTIGKSTIFSRKTSEKKLKSDVSKKGKGKGKATVFDGEEVHWFTGDIKPYNWEPWKKSDDKCDDDNKSVAKSSVVSLASVTLVLSETEGGVGGSGAKGTEQYEMVKKGLKEWGKDDYERAKKGWGPEELERAKMIERMEKAERERMEKEAKWT